MGKGADYERQFAKQLSLWWTNQEDDSIFWRTQGSGARATSRTKKGLKTKGQYGDIAAVDSSGEDLINYITFELKRGYSSDTLMDLIDKFAKKSKYREFLEKAMKSASEAGTPHWALIVKRDRATPLMLMDEALYKVLIKCVCNEVDDYMLNTFYFRLPFLTHIVYGIPVDYLLHRIDVDKLKSVISNKEDVQ